MIRSPGDGAFPRAGDNEHLHKETSGMSRRIAAIGIVVALAVLTLTLSGCIIICG